MIISQVQPNLQVFRKIIVIYFDYHLLFPLAPEITLTPQC
jgi:hypothetical protein